MPPTVSVVMPSRNRLDQIAPLVLTYLELGADEVVVVLDGPHPGWQTALDAFAGDDRVQVVELGGRAGLALARVAGLQRAGSEIILLADDDVIPGAGLIERHRQFHAATSRAALLGYMPVALPARRSRDQAPTFLYARDYENQAEEWRRSAGADILTSFWGGNASVERADYLAAEAFKPSTRLNYNEDLDLGLRLRAIGLSGQFDELAVAAHEHRRSFEAFLAECFVRGEAVADLELRWNSVPGQLVQLVAVPAGAGRLVAFVQRRIARRDDPGAIDRSIAAAYRIAGALRLWRVQDDLSRLIRRGIAMRGYRVTKSRRIVASEASAD
jgi:glycosyltransferase involved in cell wall biosynthesis